MQHITFVDNGIVSFSNPVRQSLFSFEDCLNGGQPKAEAAARALKMIFPGVVSVISLSFQPSIFSQLKCYSTFTMKLMFVYHSSQISSGVQLSIPMPGHSIGDSMLQETKDTVASLEKLVGDHDVVFLLTDSRESRWLPTLLAGSQKKACIQESPDFSL